MTPSLDQLRPGQRARIESLDGDDALAQRLMEMGVFAGQELEVIRFAPLGEPVEIRLGDRDRRQVVPERRQPADPERRRYLLRLRTRGVQRGAPASRGVTGELVIIQEEVTQSGESQPEPCQGGILGGGGPPARRELIREIDIDLQELSADDRRVLFQHAVLLTFADTDMGTDDIDLLRLCLSMLPPRSPKRAGLVARIEKLEAE